MIPLPEEELGVTDLFSPIDALSEAEIARRLAHNGKAETFHFSLETPNLVGEPRCAAVLVPLTRYREQWHLLLTRRTDSVQDHKGQVAFPGGGCEPEDQTPEATALREAHEEIGLQPDDARVLGRLRPLHTVSGFIVTPVVASFQYPYPFSLSVDEVSRAFIVPLEWLRDAAHRSERARIWEGVQYPVIYYELYEGEMLWGVSARITVDLLIALGY